MIKSDDQAGFFMVKDIPSPPHQTSVWFHNGRGKTTVSSLVIIPIMFYYLLSYPFHILYGKKRVQTETAIQGLLKPPLLFLFFCLSLFLPLPVLELIKNV